MEDTSKALLNLLERVFGKSEPKSRENYAFKCLNGCHPSKNKLEVNINTQFWNCWICGANDSYKGKSIRSLFKKYKVAKEYFYELNLINPAFKGALETQNQQIQLPEEFVSLLDDPTDSLLKILFKQAKHYLKTRHVNDMDILKYNIGICDKGKYEGRIIIPSYDGAGNLNYFIARDFSSTQSAYKNPPIKNANIIGMEYFINWNLPIILVEGIFDHLTIKRNCIPLFGKNISEELYKRLATSQVKKVYICLDTDALKSSLKYCEKLMNEGKEVYLIELSDKDVSETGFKKFLNIIEKTPIFTFQELVTKKLNL